MGKNHFYRTDITLLRDMNININNSSKNATYINIAIFYVVTKFNYKVYINDLISSMLLL
jgi:hypothetical protein